MEYSRARNILLLIVVLALFDVWAYGASAQASIPGPAPPLLQGIPVLPSPGDLKASSEAIPEPPAEAAIEASAQPSAEEKKPEEGLNSAPVPKAAPSEPAPIELGAQSPTPNTSAQSADKPLVQPIEQNQLPSLQPIALGGGNGPTSIELAGKIDRLETRIASVEEEIKSIPQTQVPAKTSGGIPSTVLFGMNLLTLGLVLYLFFRPGGSSSSSAGTSGKIGAKDAKALKNIKDYMQRYQAQGYQVNNMKTFLITQGYPQDLVEQAAKELQAQGGFRQ